MYTLYAINEAKFKSVEDAKNAYNKLQKDDDFFDWFKTKTVPNLLLLCTGKQFSLRYILHGLSKIRY